MIKIQLKGTQVLDVLSKKWNSVGDKEDCSEKNSEKGVWMNSKIQNY